MRWRPSVRGAWRAFVGRFIDAQSNRTSPQGGECGFDAAKKAKGRKRNLVVDTLGLVIGLTVTAYGGVCLRSSLRRL
jgi:putative transposase